MSPLYLCGILPAWLHLAGPYPLSATLAQIPYAEPLSTVVSHYVLSAVGSVLAILLGLAIRLLRQQTETRVKANLCFDDLKERKPEVERYYDALMEHGWGRR